MRNKLSKKTVIVVFILLLALLAVVATVSAADVSGSDATLAKVDLQGAEGLTVVPISGTDHRLISPWGIDATRVSVY